MVGGLSDFNLLTPTSAGADGAEKTLAPDEEKAKKIQQRNLIAEYMRLAETPITRAKGGLAGLDKGDALKIGISTALSALLAGVAGGKNANFGNIVGAGVAGGLQQLGMEAKSAGEQAQIADELALEQKKQKLQALKLQIDTNENTANRLSNLVASGNPEWVIPFMQDSFDPVDVREVLAKKGIAKDRAEAIENAYKLIADMPNGAPKGKAITALNAILPKHDDGTPAIPPGVIEMVSQPDMVMTVQDMIREFGPSSVDAVKAYLGSLKAGENKPVEYFLSMVDWTGYKAQEDAKHGAPDSIDQEMKREGWALWTALNAKQKDPAFAGLNLEQTMQAMGWTDAEKALLMKVTPKAGIEDPLKYLRGVGSYQDVNGLFGELGDAAQNMDNYNAWFEAKQKQEQEEVNQFYLRQAAEAVASLKRENPNWVMLDPAEQRRLILERLGWNARQMNQYMKAATADTTGTVK